MSLLYNTDLGYGICIKQHEVEGRPRGYVVEVHFYDRAEAVKYAAQLIHIAQQEAEQS
jgi:hypothetical protein